MSAARRARRRRDEAGVALVMVVAAIAVLAVMLADFQDDASAEHASATADRDSVQAEYMARSAVNLSRLLIATEPTFRASIAPMYMLLARKQPPQLPIWLYSDRMLGAFNDKEGEGDFARTTGLDLSLGKNLGMPGGRFELKIVDEDAKINVNQGGANEVAHQRLGRELMGLFVPPQYNPLFEQKDPQGTFHDRMTTCAALVDWADEDERLFNCDQSQTTAVATSGVEDGYYALLPKSYRRKNAPYDSLEELHSVRGVSDDFWATFVDPNPENPEKRPLTVWGQAKVNVNTANAQTLLGVVCAGAPQAEMCTNIEKAGAFVMGVTMARGMSMGAPVFSTPRDFLALLKGETDMSKQFLKLMGLTAPVKFRAEGEVLNSISTESKVFSIYAIGVVKGYRRETRTSIHAVVDFRNAPAPGYAGGMPGAPGTPGVAGTPGAAGLAGAAGLPGVAGAAGGVPGGTAAGLAGTSGEFASALKPSTGGTVIYYRIQ